MTALAGAGNVLPMNTTYIVAGLILAAVVGYVVLAAKGKAKEADTLMMGTFFLTVLYGVFSLMTKVV